MLLEITLNVVNTIYKYLHLVIILIKDLNYAELILFFAKEAES